MGALFKTYDTEALRRQRDEVFTRVLEHWPEDSAATRRALEKVIGEQPIVS
jgi:hypothetical protein